MPRPGPGTRHPRLGCSPTQLCTPNPGIGGPRITRLRPAGQHGGVSLRPLGPAASCGSRRAQPIDAGNRPAGNQDSEVTGHTRSRSSSQSRAAQPAPRSPQHSLGPAPPRSVCTAAHGSSWQHTIPLSPWPSMDISLCFPHGPLANGTAVTLWAKFCWKMVGTAQGDEEQARQSS